MLHLRKVKLNTVQHFYHGNAFKLLAYIIPPDEGIYTIIPHTKMPGCTCSGIGTEVIGGEGLIIDKTYYLIDEDELNYIAIKEEQNES